MKKSTAPLHIVIDLTPVLPAGDNGGAKIFTLELIEQLSDLYPKAQFTLLTHQCSHDTLAHLDRENVCRIMVIKRSWKQTLRAQLRRLAKHTLPYLPKAVGDTLTTWGYNLNAKLKRQTKSTCTLLEQLGADVLFCPFTAPTYAEPNVPTVCTLYDLQYKTYPDFFDAADLAHRDKVFVDACQKATLLTAISDYSRESALKHAMMSPDKIHTVHIRTAKRLLTQDNDDPDVLDRFGLNKNEYLIYPANFWPHKNHHRLIDAFKQYSENAASSIQLVCTGSPNKSQQAILDYCQSQGLSSIIFPGYLDEASLRTLMKHSRGVIFPSLYEGFGLPVVEAMAMAIPVACSHIGALPEVAADGALFFDPKDVKNITQAIQTLLSDENNREALVLKGLKRASYFSDVKQMALEYWSIFEQSITLHNP